MASFIAKTDWGLDGPRYFARILSLIWAVGWIMFGLVSGVGEEQTLRAILGHIALPGFLFLVTSVIAWWWEAFGGMLLFLEGAAIAVYFLADFNRISVLGMSFVLLTATLPAIFISFLFLASWRRSRSGEFAARGTFDIRAGR